MGQSFSAEQLPDLSGKTYVITGANTGIGLVTACELARRQARVIITCRSAEKATAAVEAIKSTVASENKNPVVESALMDLSSLASVVGTAERILELTQESGIDCVVANAGVMMCPFSLSADGLDLQFATNHLGHFVFTGLLLPRLRGERRVICVASAAHHAARRVWTKEELTQDHGAVAAYAHSKLCNILFAKELAKKQPKLHVLSLHPGYVATDLSRNVRNTYGFVIDTVRRYLVEPVFARTSENGALTSLYAAAHPDALKVVSGSYLVPTARVGSPNAAANDMTQASQLFSMSMDLVSSKLGPQVHAKLEKNFSTQT